MNVPPERLSLSRDALRADLAEMELRLRAWIGSEMDRVSGRLGSLETTLTPAQANAVKEIVRAEIESTNKSSWTRRDRLMAVVGVIVAVISVTLTGILVYTTLHHPKALPAPTVRHTP